MADKRVQPHAIRRKAIKLYGLGHAATSIAKELGVSDQTVRRWAKEAGVEKKAMVESKIESEDDFTLPIEVDESLPIVRLLNKQKADNAIAQAVKQTASPTEQYQTMVAANGLRMLDAAFKCAPQVKNMRDLKTLTEIVRDSLGLSGKAGIGGKLAIDLNILTRPQQTVEVRDAVIVENNS